MFVYNVQVGTYTRKGNLQVLFSQVVSSKNTQNEIEGFFSSKYEGLSVLVSECKVIDVETEHKKISVNNIYKNKLINKQYFKLEDFLSDIQLSAWKEATKNKLAADDMAKKVIEERLEIRTEVKYVENIDINLNGNFSCEIVINGDLWQV